MFKWLGDIRRCKDASGNYIEKGEYENPNWGRVYFVQENKPACLIEYSSWNVKHPHLAENGELVMRTEVLDRNETRRCVRVGNSSPEDFLENARRKRETSRSAGAEEPAEAEEIEVTAVK